MADFLTLRRRADDAMRNGDYRAANDQYLAAWDDYATQRTKSSKGGDGKAIDKQHTAKDAFWLLLSGANAQFRAEDFAGCLDTCITAFNLFRDLGYVVGNPFFHLRVGQANFELEPTDDHDPSGMTIDNLARALICGGIEIFHDEDEKYLEPVLDVLRPPEGYSSWHDATGEGCSLDKLNGATGYLAELFASKYGAPPPYPAP